MEPTELESAKIEEEKTGEAQKMEEKYKDSKRAEEKQERSVM